MSCDQRFPLLCPRPQAETANKYRLKTRGMAGSAPGTTYTVADYGTHVLFVHVRTSLVLQTLLSHVLASTRIMCMDPIM